MRKVCCNCKKVIEELIPGTEDYDVDTHGICPECVPEVRKLMRVLPEWDKENKRWIRGWKE